MHGRLLGGAQLLNEGGILRLIHGAVDVVRRALIIAAGEKGAVHVHALKRDDGRNGIVKVQVKLRAQALDLLGHGITRDADRVAMTTSPSGMAVASARSTVMFGCAQMRSVISRAKASRSTASAPPAATRL